MGVCIYSESVSQELLVAASVIGDCGFLPLSILADEERTHDLNLRLKLDSECCQP